MTNEDNNNGRGAVHEQIMNTNGKRIMGVRGGRGEGTEGGKMRPALRQMKSKREFTINQQITRNNYMQQQRRGSGSGSGRRVRFVSHRYLDTFKPGPAIFMRKNNKRNA